jgi:endonuclease/exonuclease/phosphatase (EEP) superfamily protein YafD
MNAVDLWSKVDTKQLARVSLLTGRRIARWMTRGAAGLVMLVLLARFVAGSSLTNEGAFLDGLDYLPPWPLSLLVVPLALACWALQQRRLALVCITTFLVLVFVEEDHWWPGRHVPTAPGAPVLKVAALNVQFYRAGREQVANAVKSMDADVVLLSENVVRPEEIPDFEALFAPLHFYAGRSEETAIVSRHPLRDVKEVELPSFQASLYRRNRLEDQPKHRRRSFLHAQLDMQGFAIHVISMRFIAGRPRSKRLGDQLAWGRYLVKTHHEEGAFFLDYLSRLKGPVIFGGDLNAPPSAKVIRRLTDVAQDAYLATHWWGRPTFDVNLAVQRLDYLFGMNGAVPVESSRLSHVVSDHYPVWARFALTQPDEEAAVTAR